MALGGVMLNRKGIMTPQVSKGLSKISMSLTIPCLLFTTAIDCTQNHSQNQCPRLSSLMRNGWPMFLMPVLYVFTGLLCGVAAARIGRAEENFRRSAIAAVAFGNSTGLPVTLLTIIYSQFGKDTQLGSLNPVLFLSVYLVLYPVLQWSVGAWLLQPRGDAGQAADAPSARPASRLRLISEPEPPLPTLAAVGWMVVKAQEHHSFAGPETVRTEMDDRRVASWHGQTLPLQDVNVEPQCQPTQPCQVEDASGMRDRALTVLRRVCPPPVVAALLGMAVAFVEPVRGLLVDTKDRDGDALLQWLFDGLAKIGAAAVPINMLILGNSVAKGASVSISIRTALSVAVAKMVVMPLVGLAVTLAMQHIELIPDGPDDSFYLVALLVSATPTANNIMVMAELAGENKEGLGACIFVQYLLCPFLLTFWLAVFVSVATSKPKTALLF